ncbi:MAG TPA: histidine kinase [Longimicrobium sp.]|nr:histidine kinase [Longimicrobium sp.]
MIRTPPVPTGDPGATSAGRMPLRTLATYVTIGWLTVAMVLAISTYASGLVAGRPLPVDRVLGQNLLSGIVWIPATLAAFLLTWRFPVDRGGSFARNVLLHLAWGVAVVVAKVAVFHLAGQALGLLRREVSLEVALAALSAESLFTYALLVGVAHAFAYARTLRERELARAQLETQLVQAQLQTLKAQLHPHFLFNTLHAISTLVHADPDRAEQVIASLSEMLRNTLAHQHDQEVTLRDELATLEPYLQIEKTRLGNRLSVEMRVDDDTLDACVPHLLLQPLVENAVKHGIGPRRAPGRIRITGSAAAGRLFLSVEDDGRGICGPPRAGAMGLDNTRARLQRLYGAAQDFALHSAPDGGTRVEVRLPFRRAAREPAAATLPGHEAAAPAARA